MGSVIDALVDHGIEIGTELVSVYAWSAATRVGNNCSGHKPTRPNGPQLCHYRTVTSQNKGPARLDLPKYGCRLIAKLALGNNAIHGQSVASVAHCSNERIIAKPTRTHT